MKKRNLPGAILGAFGLLVLILDGQTAISGIRSGIDICLKTLIPSLFPFFVISGLITGSLSGCSIPFLRRLCKSLRIPQGSESLLLVGFLSGYPVGAKNVHDVRINGQLSDADSQRLALLCSNAGPAFIFGILGPVFLDLRWSWTLWGLQTLSAIAVIAMLPGGSDRWMKRMTKEACICSGLISQAVKSMASVCAWVSIFRMVLVFLDRWFYWLLPDCVRILAVGILELANGCLELTCIRNMPIRFLLASLLLPFGGFCVLMQIRSVFPELDFAFYLKGKLLQSSICFLMALSVIPIFAECQPGIYGAGSGIGIFLAFLFHHFFLKRKKEVAIP